MQAHKAGLLLAAWDGDRWCVPDFQWTAEGHRHPRLSELLAALPRQRDGSLGVAAVLWMWAPTDALDGCDPASMFATDPERVIQRARHRQSDSDED